jgi:GMP synthase-like glutamine amidotransferase
MKIGLLLCGDIPPSLKRTFGSYAECLTDRFKLGTANDVLVWNVYQDNIPDWTNPCDIYIVGGSPASVHDKLDWIFELAKFVQHVFKQGKKILGICFGHQLVNYALGGVIRRHVNGWGLGSYTVSVYKDYNSLRQGQTFSLLAMHQDQVITAAKNFEVIAGNNFCPNYMTAYKNQILTIQGHPEFCRPFFNALLRERTKTFSTAALEKASQTANAPLDAEEVNKLINNFVTTVI